MIVSTTAGGMVKIKCLTKTQHRVEGEFHKFDVLLTSKHNRDP